MIPLRRPVGIVVLAIVSSVAGCGGDGGGEARDEVAATRVPQEEATGPGSSPGTAAATSMPGETDATGEIEGALTPADDGRVFSMTVGQVAQLLVHDPLAPDPAIAGDAVEVISVVNIQASGRREWELRAQRQGTTVVSADGSQPYTVTLIVSP